MIDRIVSFFAEFSPLNYTSWLVILTYWVPFGICFGCYLGRSMHNYFADVENSVKDRYVPTLTVGTIVARLFVVVCPVVNILAAVFDCLAAVIDFIRDVLNIPLVRKRTASK